MADYCGKIRTNYFSVTDVDKFHQLMEMCVSDGGPIKVFMDKSTDDGSTMFGFYCNGTILGLPEAIDNTEPNDLDYESCDDDYDLDLFYMFLQRLLTKDTAIIITEIGSKEFCYFIGECTIITKTEMRVLEVQTTAIIEAREMLGNDDYMTRVHD